MNIQPREGDNLADWEYQLFKGIVNRVNSISEAYGVTPEECYEVVCELAARFVEEIRENQMRRF